MSDKGNPAMHPEFPTWYREVDLGENRDRLQGRWKGVSTVVGQATRADVEALLAIVFRARRPSSIEGLAHIRQQFKNADESFEMSGNNKELEILSGATLAVLLERTDETAAFTALAVTAASLNGARITDLPMNLPSLAEAATAKLSEQRRQRPKLDRQRLKAVPKVDFAEAKAKFQAQPNATGMDAALDIAADSVNLALDTMGKLLSTSLRENDTFIAIQDEELELLWWIIGEHSDDLNQRFDEVSPNVRPLVFAKELADATEFLPGPLSIRSLLSRVGLRAETMLTIPDAVNACDDAWLARLLSRDNVSALVYPIHFAIERKLETGDDTSWLAGWAKACGIEEQRSFSELDLGCLFYGERLLSTLG